jgi:hypothetical protein
MDKQIPEQLLNAVNVLREANNGARVVLYLDPTMQHGENYLPTLNVEGDDGYFRVPDFYRPHMARFFGPDYRAAKRLVDEVNEYLGVPADEALEIVIGVMFHGGAK